MALVGQYPIVTVIVTVRTETELRRALTGPNVFYMAATIPAHESEQAATPAD